MENTDNMEFENNVLNIENNIFLEEETDSLEVAGTWGSLGTFGSSVGSCASSAGSASSFG
ncbi:hypothetical protein IGI37_000259 [Enterococcus sp. AZ194]|uniref:thiocillin family RiPP n=1 Tax=Enterococcus sp. AZ194 TaxID=2774629 RepID=UPI003F220E8A